MQHPSLAPAGAGRHFAPASLLPYGGFGQPEHARPIWTTAGVDPDRLRLAQVQHDIARRVRSALSAQGVAEGALEAHLGYRKQGLARKLNGQEQMTMRDLTRLLAHFGSSLVGGDLPTAAATLGEGAPDYRSAPEPPAAVDARFHEQVHRAAALLDEAASTLRSGAGPGPADEAAAASLEHLARAVLAIGAGVANR